MDPLAMTGGLHAQDRIGSVITTHEIGVMDVWRIFQEAMEVMDRKIIIVRIMFNDRI